MNIQDILPILPEVRDEGKGYHMVDDGGVEIEVGEFLWGLVKILKPHHVLTTGIYTGVSDSYIGLALKENGFGMSDAIEFEEKHIVKAKELFLKLKINDCITTHFMSSLDFQPVTTYQLIFLDTEPEIRFKELEKFYLFLDEGGFIGIHDTPRNLCQGNVNPEHPKFKSWPFGDVPDQMKYWIINGDLTPIYFPNPRGLSFFYKPKDEDYYGI